MLTFASLPPLSLYVHLPWCVKKCPYCDFNSHAQRREALPVDQYIDALIRDLDSALPQVWGRSIRTIFIGGGTPNLFPPESIRRLLSEIRARCPFNATTEVTMEANPGADQTRGWQGYMAAGVNRFSLGVQSFNDVMLADLGRIHSGGDAARTIAGIREAGCTNLNLDLMFGLPQQTLTMAETDIEHAINLAPEHISLYQLTIEPNTYFHRFQPVLPSDDDCWTMQNTLQQRLADAGYEQYEVSAYASAGTQCRHNLNYWTFGDYLGIGAGAHSKISTPNHVSRQWKTKHPAKYIDSAGTAAAIGGSNTISFSDLPLEFMMNALRLTGGFSASLFAERTGLPLSTVEPVVSMAKDRDMMWWTSGGMGPTAQGQRFLNDLLALFLENPPSLSIPIQRGI